MGEGGDAATIENRALERFRLIEPFLQGARTLASIAAQADVNLRTAQRWVDLYRRHGLEALAQKQRVDRGTKRAMSQKMVKPLRAWRSSGLEFPSLRSIES
jgi:putative transposase